MIISSSILGLQAQFIATWTFSEKKKKDSG